VVTTELRSINFASAIQAKNIWIANTGQKKKETHLPITTITSETGTTSAAAAASTTTPGVACLENENRETYVVNLE
jgi:hypothetical protein